MQQNKSGYFHATEITDTCQNSKIYVKIHSIFFLNLRLFARSQFCLACIFTRFITMLDKSSQNMRIVLTILNDFKTCIFSFLCHDREKQLCLIKCFVINLGYQKLRQSLLPLMEQTTCLINSQKACFALSALYCSREVSKSASFRRCNRSVFLLSGVTVYLSGQRKGMCCCKRLKCFQLTDSNLQSCNMCDGFHFNLWINF